MKLVALFVIALTSGGVAVGWHVVARGNSEVARLAYTPKHELRLTVPDSHRGEFLAAVEIFASQNGFELKHDQSGLPLKDGRAIVYLMFSRGDGVEIRITDVLKPGEMIIDFYDKLETGNWKEAADNFSKNVMKKFGTDKV